MIVRVEKLEVKMRSTETYPYEELVPNETIGNRGKADEFGLQMQHVAEHWVPCKLN